MYIFQAWIKPISTVAWHPHWNRRARLKKLCLSGLTCETEKSVFLLCIFGYSIIPGSFCLFSFLLCRPISTSILCFPIWCLCFPPKSSFMSRQHREEVSHMCSWGAVLANIQLFTHSKKIPKKCNNCNTHKIQLFPSIVRWRKVCDLFQTNVFLRECYFFHACVKPMTSSLFFLHTYIF